AEYLNQASARGDVFLDTGSGVIFGRNGPFHNQYYIKITGGFSSPEEFIVFDPVEGEFFPQSGFEQFPVTRLTWYGAAAFCDFYGLRLPTEAEWEKACRGGQQLEFGTQDGTLTHDLANFAGTGGRDTYQGAAPVGSFPPNPFGLFDMCANAAEHVFDLYDPDYYQNSPNENPKGPGPPMPVGRLDFITVIRGGGGNSSSIFCRSAFRGVFDNLPDLEVLSGTLSGFRVARSLP
ncbi:MAG: formylglycine-generating enzyme family protein, partial [bacterium]